jgi:hypothetical protein
MAQQENRSCQFCSLLLCDRARRFTQKKIFVNKGERLNPSGRPLHLLYGTTSLTMRIGQLLCAFILSIVPIAAPGQQIDGPLPQRKHPWHGE